MRIREQQRLPPLDGPSHVAVAENVPEKADFQAEKPPGRLAQPLVHPAGVLPVGHHVDDEPYVADRLVGAGPGGL